MVNSKLYQSDYLTLYFLVGFNKDSSEHHYLFMCLLMTASDLSDQTKHFKYSKIIAVCFQNTKKF